MKIYIPKEFVKSDEFSGMKGTAGCFALEINNADSIRRLRDLCDFALTKP
jgi:hypothetical protein